MLLDTAIPTENLPWKINEVLREAQNHANINVNTHENASEQCKT